VVFINYESGMSVKRLAYIDLSFVSIKTVACDAISPDFSGNLNFKKACYHVAILHVIQPFNFFFCYITLKGAND
jgi:hypothetical protein